MSAKNKVLHTKKGFTLVELCIVLAIAAIVGTMITGAILFVSNQNSDIQKDADFIGDVTDIQKTVNDWLKQYDTAKYTITHTSGFRSLEAKNASGSCILSFSDNTLKSDDIAISKKYGNVSGVSFQIIEDKAADGSLEGKVIQIKVTAKKGSGEEYQTLLFPVFSDKTRSRSVTGKNG